MKKYSVLLTVILLLVMVVPAFAYNRVTGSVVDSLNSDPWVWGGEVYVYNVNTGDICGSGILSPTGMIGYDADNDFSTTGDFVAGLPINGTIDNIGFGVVNCTTGMTGQPLELLIDFECSAGFAACTPPEGYPGTHTRQFTQNAIPIAFNAGYIYTGTGPTAVTLQGFDGGTTGSLPVMAGLAVVLLAGLTMFVVRRRQI